ncbi:inositol monophosphatase [Nocardioides zeae]|uniref:Inositol monophosphatase n=1 Tax=Nocardioides imazamoxiresistens TaxID=3231893 RepID=A0ABU3PUK8_9ACTN|nr:inositol monophosphatase [Nocardioides zeae]MDT9592527.1 inositol monophosphatase [Nocardioides zeae]
MSGVAGLDVPAHLVEDMRLAGALVREAGGLAARMRAEGVEGLDVARKTSVSDVVTAADHAAEELVAGRLADARPADGILGEEGVDEAGSSGRRWVVDPVDGTYNFLSGLTWWCSALALLDGDELVLGAIYHPHDDQLFLGGPAIGSARDGRRLDPLPDVPLERASLATYFHPSSLSGPTGAAFVRASQGAAVTRVLGSGSMDATAVAQGHLGLVLQHSVPPWDELPGAAIVRGAGGTTRRIAHEGVEWYAAGAPSAVAEACRALVHD